MRAVGLIELIAIVAVIAAVVVAVARKGGGGGTGSGAGAARRIVVYLLLFGVLIVAAVGVAQILALLLPGGDTVVDTGSADVARALSLSLVGVPAFLLLWRFVARDLDQDPSERRSPAWALFVTLTGFVFLLGGVIGLGTGLQWVFGLETTGRTGLAIGVVFTGVWAWSWTLLTGRRRPEMLAEAPAIVGSVVGLATLVAATGAALTDLLSAAYDRITGASVLEPGIGESLARVGIWLVLGAAVWWWHWLRQARSAEPSVLRNVYVLVVGVLGGAIAALGALGSILYAVLEWFLGDPAVTEAARHFSNLPSELAAMGIGTLVWSYHRSVVRETPEVARSDVGRADRYLLAGVGLVAAASGLGVVVNSLLAASVSTVAGGSTINLFLSGLTALLIGVPVWWTTWVPLQSRTSPEEVHSAPRRVYLAILAGVGGITAIVSLIILLFRLFEGVLEETTTSALVDNIRAPLGVVVATAIVAWYHIVVWRRERTEVPAPARPRLRQVILIAADPAGLDVELRRRLDTTVTVWRREGGDSGVVDVDDVVSRVTGLGTDRALVLVSDGRTDVVALTD